MTREEYKIKVIKITKLGMDIHHTSQALFTASEEYISYLQVTIEAQEIIIKDRSSIMEAMAQPKTCEGCKWLPNEDEYGMTLCSHKYTCARQESEDYYEPKVQL